MKRYIRAIKRRTKNILQPICVKSRFLTALYYLFFDPAFGREQQAVLKGLIDHNVEAKKLKANYFLLVRNTHRIEKGLLMRPRRDVFALNYIEETITSFEGVWSYEEMRDNAQMKWFYDVLNNYFDAVKKDNETIQNCLNRFKEKVIQELKKKGHEGEVSDGKSSPYCRTFEDKDIPSFEMFHNLTIQRRSVRWFLDKEVPRELIDKAIKAAIQSPSACNRQPFEFRIFDNPEKVDEIVKIPMGTRGYHHNIKSFVVIVGNLKAYFHERDRHNIYVDGSLAAMPFMLALETMGLSSCSINWPDIEEKEKKMASILKLKQYQRPVMCLCVGYPDPKGMVGCSEKSPLAKIRRYN